MSFHAGLRLGTSPARRSCPGRHERHDVRRDDSRRSAPLRRRRMTDQERIAALRIDKVNVVLGVTRADLLEEMTAAGISAPIDPAAAAAWAADPSQAPVWVRRAQHRARTRKENKLRRKRAAQFPGSGLRGGGDETARARATLLARPIAGASRPVPMSQLRATKSQAVPAFVLCRVCGQKTIVAKKNLLGRHESADKAWCEAGRTPVTDQDVPVPPKSPRSSPRPARPLATAAWSSREALNAKFRGIYSEDASPLPVDDVAPRDSSVPTVPGGLPSLGKRR